MNDLVSRLRLVGDFALKDYPNFKGPYVTHEAADRIDELEKALREAYQCIDECCPHRIPNQFRVNLGERNE